MTKSESQRSSAILGSALFLLVLSAAGLVRAQSQQPDQPQAAQPSDKKQDTSKAKKPSEKQVLKELATPYKKWLSEDVSYIITDSERKAFLQLQTNEERENFIEQFWQRRNPDPDSVDNTYKEEHYRRIAYANEHFASGFAGWKSDRGRIYIMYGKPDDLESHTQGETWERPLDQGGGQTSTYAYEDWTYHYIEGIGENVELEFVDHHRHRRIPFDYRPLRKRRFAHGAGRRPDARRAAGAFVQIGSLPE